MSWVRVLPHKLTHTFFHRIFGATHWFRGRYFHFGNFHYKLSLILLRRIVSCDMPYYLIHGIVCTLLNLILDDLSSTRLLYGKTIYNRTSFFPTVYTNNRNHIHHHIYNHGAHIHTQKHKHYGHTMSIYVLYSVSTASTWQ